MDPADVVGVDIGGTKTLVRVRQRAGDERDSVTPTADWRPVEQQRDPRALLGLLTAVTDLSADTVVAIGAHGCDTRPQCVEFARALSAHSPATFVVVNDAELLVPAAGLTRGIGLVVGTGSIVVGETTTGDLLSAGGWGWLLGDPGSAPALVRESVKVILAAADAGVPPDELSRGLCTAYRVDTPLELAYALTAARSITHWASHAAVVFDAARAGSTLAGTVLDAQIDELVGQVAALRRRGAQGEHVVIAGGVAAGQPAFAKDLATRLEARLELSATVLQGEPVQGALALAERHRTRTRPDPQPDQDSDPSPIPGAGPAERGGSTP